MTLDLVIIGVVVSLIVVWVLVEISDFLAERTIRRKP